MVKKGLLFFLALLMLWASVGCAASSKSGVPPSNVMTGGLDENYRADEHALEMGAGPAPEDVNTDVDTSVTDTAISRKIIRNASLDLEVTNVIDAYDHLLDWVLAHGGYEVSRVQNKSDQYVIVDAQFRLAPEHLDAFLAFADGQGEVINTQITTEDITDAYFDTQTRLNTMETALDQYYGFLKEAKNIEESLIVQEEINRLTLDIESLKGKLTVWDRLLDLSLITLRLRQSSDPTKIRKEVTWSTLSFSDMVYLMHRGLSRVANTTVSVFQWLAIAAVVLSPVWLLVLVVLLIIWLIRRKGRKKAADQAPDKEA